MIGSQGPTTPAGVILAGGQASRLGGGDKGMQLLAGTPIMKLILDRMRSGAQPVLLSANGDPARFQGIGWLENVDIVGDGEPDQPGPLAGILAAMDRVVTLAPGCRWLLCLPCDTPFLPNNLVQSLTGAVPVDGQAIAMAAGPDGRSQPTVALWPTSLREDLRRALRVEGVRKVRTFAARHGMVTVPFPAGPDGVDPFFNVNTPDDLVRADAIIRSAGP